MSTDYRFSLTPRLVALALFGGVALMVLLFALGYQVGQHLARQEAAAVPSAADAAGRRLLDQAGKNAAGAAAPLKKALQ